MKAAVCILIILLSAAVGNGLRSDIKRRCESLESLAHICRKMQSEISFRSPPISELISEHCTDSRCGVLFQKTQINMEEGFSAAWNTGAVEWAKSISLNTEETDTVLMLKNLGGADTEGENHLLGSIAQRLQEHADNERNELNTKGKMMFSCSVLTGLALVIFII